MIVRALSTGTASETLTLLRQKQSGGAPLYQRNSNNELTQYAIIKETVSIERIDNLCSQLGITVIDSLKLVIEGHELAALQGCSTLLTKGKINYIQFEFDGCNIDSRTYFHDFGGDPIDGLKSGISPTLVGHALWVGGIPADLIMSLILGLVARTSVVWRQCGPGYTMHIFVFAIFMANFSVLVDAP